ncbi:KPN_02809 family neutral zinc metallopeptidase [Leptolyngbya ohadii]|uniref:KPN_02809 family neutral zinc metallopeptidase n=1 Tax=Leptolyngbya ohadii TaxID=1962290 RepID=UPI000B5A064A|nr:neutral zinc metallopeptidase [Leptolyngbya ohadii]
MRWDFGRRSRNVEDRRGGGGAGVPIVGGGIGAVLLALVVALLGGDPSAIFEQAQSPGNYETAPSRAPGQDQQAEFVSVVLASTEDTWGALFQQAGERYADPKLVLFNNVVQSACGAAESAMGPFYCPRDQSVYIDLSFFNEMKTKLGAPGDFAQAYVIAHEVGHHVQNLLGISRQVQGLQQRVGRTEANQLSVRLELQADCFAGVWAHHADRNQIGISLEQGDIEEGLNAASAIGDDRLQERSRGYAVPDSFTHGSSAQRVRWFKQGLQTGNPDQCNTFEVANP